MSHYVTVRLTVAQAQAASNACDLIRDSLEADGDKREAALYERASKALSQFVPTAPKKTAVPTSKEKIE